MGCFCGVIKFMSYGKINSDKGLDVLNVFLKLKEIFVCGIII